MRHEAFVSGKFDTHFVKNHYTPDIYRAEPDEEMIAALLAVRVFGIIPYPEIPLPESREGFTLEIKQVKVC